MRGSQTPAAAVHTHLRLPAAPTSAPTAASRTNHSGSASAPSSLVSYLRLSHCPSSVLRCRPPSQTYSGSASCPQQPRSHLGHSPPPPPGPPPPLPAHAHQDQPMPPAVPLAPPALPLPPPTLAPPPPAQTTQDRPVPAAAPLDTSGSPTAPPNAPAAASRTGHSGSRQCPQQTLSQHLRPSRRPPQRPRRLLPAQTFQMTSTRSRSPALLALLPASPNARTAATRTFALG